MFIYYFTGLATTVLCWCGEISFHPKDSTIKWTWGNQKYEMTLKRRWLVGVEMSFALQHNGRLFLLTWMPLKACYVHKHTRKKYSPILQLLLFRINHLFALPVQSKATKTRATFSSTNSRWDYLPCGDHDVEGRSRTIQCLRARPSLLLRNSNLSFLSHNHMNMVKIAWMK